MKDNSDLCRKLNDLFETVTERLSEALDGGAYDNEALKTAITFLKNNEVKLNNLPEAADTGVKAPRPTVPFRNAVGE